MTDDTTKLIEAANDLEQAVAVLDEALMHIGYTSSSVHKAIGEARGQAVLRGFDVRTALSALDRPTEETDMTEPETRPATEAETAAIQKRFDAALSASMPPSGTVSPTEPVHQAPAAEQTLAEKLLDKLNFYAPESVCLVHEDERPEALKEDIQALVAYRATGVREERERAANLREVAAAAHDVLQKGSPISVHGAIHEALSAALSTTGDDDE